MGDRQSQIHYEEQALPFATEYGFAAYNFAQLLLSDGQLVRAEHYATRAQYARGSEIRPNLISKSQSESENGSRRDQAVWSGTRISIANFVCSPESGYWHRIG
jgi:hypothetical protein